MKMFGFKMLTISLIVCFVLTMLSSFASSINAATGMKLSDDQISITPKDEEVGKWLVTISIGGGLSENATLALRNVMKDVFPKVKGGKYSHFIDIDDINPANGEPTKTNINAVFNKLRADIARYKKEKPGSRTMVLISLTGHGATRKGKYYFALQDEYYSGEEIVKLIDSIKANETILFMQSCQSGGLVNKHFSQESIFKVKEDIIKFAKDNKISLAVVTPVTKHINSQALEWESILLRSFYDDSADVDENGIVTYEEWKNYIIIASSAHYLFKPVNLYVKPDGSEKKLPLEIPSAGLNPQFFDAFMPGELPFYLTSSGIEKYENDQIRKSLLTNYNTDTSTIYSDTVKFFKEQAALTEELYSTEDVDSIVDKFNATQGLSKYKVFLHMSHPHYTYTPKLGSLLFNIFKNATNTQGVKTAALQIIGIKGPDEGGENKVEKQFDREILSYVKTEFTNLMNTYKDVPQKMNFTLEELEAETKQSVKITYINAFGDLAVVSQLFEDENNKDAVNDELFEILCESGNPYLRISAAQNIGKISESGKYEQATRQKIVNKLFHVMNKDNEPEGAVRAQATIAINKANAKLTRAQIEHLLDTDPSVDMRITLLSRAAALLHDAEVAFEIIKKSIEKDPSWQVRGAVAFALAALPKEYRKRSMDALKELYQKEKNSLVKNCMEGAYAKLEKMEEKI